MAIGQNYNKAHSVYDKFSQNNTQTKVGFLQGTQEALNALITSGTAKEGYFYLTSDSHRLYVGRKTGDKVYPVPVNEGITTVSNINALPADSGKVNAGEFYYCTSENVLAVVGGVDAEGNIRWIQLNKVNSLVESDSAISVAKTSQVGLADVVTVSSSVADTSGATAEGSFSLKAGSNVDLSVNGKEIEIGIAAGANTTYTMGAGASATEGGVDINLTASTEVDDDNSVITLKSSDIAIAAKDNVVTLTGKDYTVNKVEVTKGETEDKGFKVTVYQDNANASQSASFAPQITYRTDADDEQALETKDFVNSIAALDVYSTEATEELIDAKIEDALQAANAMTFKGGVDGEHPIPTTKVQNGDTYIINQEGLTNSQTDWHVGDLIIAQGTEGEDGYISGSINWIHVASSKDEIIGGSLLTHGAKITSTHASDDSTNLSGLQLAIATGEDGIVLEDSVDSTGAIRIVTVKHKVAENAAAKTVTTSVAEGDRDAEGEKDYTLTYVKNVATDKYGHITTLETDTATITDSHVQFNGSTSAAVAADDKKSATVTHTLLTSDSNDGEESGKVKFTSETLTLSAPTDDADQDTAVVNVELTWGTF